MVISMVVGGCRSQGNGSSWLLNLRSTFIGGRGFLAMQFKAYVLPSLILYFHGVLCMAFPFVVISWIVSHLVALGSNTEVPEIAGQFHTFYLGLLAFRVYFLFQDVLIQNQVSWLIHVQCQGESKCRSTLELEGGCVLELPFFQHGLAANVGGYQASFGIN